MESTGLWDWYSNLSCHLLSCGHPPPPFTVSGRKGGTVVEVKPVLCLKLCGKNQNVCHVVEYSNYLVETVLLFYFIADCK